MVVAGNEGERARMHAAVEVGIQQRHGKLLEEQRGCGGVAVMQLIPHVQGLGHHGFQVRMGQTAHRDLHRAEKLGPEPAQPVEHFGRIRAETKHSPQALVEITKGAVTAGGVFDDPHRHRRADDSCHRPDRSMRVAWLKSNPTARGQRFRRLERVRPPLVKDGTGDCACWGPHMSAQAMGGPECRIRRSPPASPGIASRASIEINEARLRGQVAFIGRAVRILNSRIANHAGQRPTKRGVGSRGRRPAEVRDRAASGTDIGRKSLQANVDDFELLLKERLHGYAFFRSEMIDADQVAASAFDEATKTPADLRPATTLFRSCGSWSVPQT